MKKKGKGHTSVFPDYLRWTLTSVTTAGLTQHFNVSDDSRLNFYFGKLYAIQWVVETLARTLDSWLPQSVQVSIKKNYTRHQCAQETVGPYYIFILGPKPCISGGE